MVIQPRLLRRNSGAAGIPELSRAATYAVRPGASAGELDTGPRRSCDVGRRRQILARVRLCKRNP